MRREVQAPGLGRRLKGPAAAVIVAGVVLATTERMLNLTTGWLAVLLIVFAILTLLALHVRFLVTFRCPNCSRLLSQYCDEAGDYGDEVRFLCHECDVMWLTGIGLSKD